MEANNIDRVLFIDESGTPCGDANQPWLVLAGVEVPSGQIPIVEQYCRDVCRSFLPADVADDPDLDLKGSSLFKQGPQAACGMASGRRVRLPFKQRIEFGRQLLALPYAQPGVQFYVSAIDTREFPDSLTLPIWSGFVQELHQQSCKKYLFALTEMIADFAFHLDRHLSSGRDEFISRPRDVSTILDGQLVIDENAILKPRLDELEQALRRERDDSTNGLMSFRWRLLDDNIVRPWQFADSKKHKLLQVADLLAAIVRLSLTRSPLWPELEELYYLSRSCFQSTRSHFYPRENVTLPGLMRWAGRSFGAEWLLRRSTNDLQSFSASC